MKCVWVAAPVLTVARFPRTPKGQYVGGGLAPRHALLTMHLDTNAFDVNIHGGKEDPSVSLKALQSVTTTAGMPVQPWDLYVGAVLEVLGQYVVLQSCSSATGGGSEG